MHNTLRVINAIYTEKDFFFVHVDALRTYTDEQDRTKHKNEADAAFQVPRCLTFMCMYVYTYM